MDMFNISSSKYKDILSKSILVSSGVSPAVYQLKSQEQKIGKLTRKTVGERNLDKMNKTILLVGETGAGKSTLINTLVNYTMGVKFEDKIWFEIVEEEKKGQSESHTSDVIVYEVFGFEDQTLPFSLTIIDTPGFGNTRGIEHDATINQQLLELFFSPDGVHEIHAVGLVMKSSTYRLSDRMKYVFDSVTSLFGKDMEKNIVPLITLSNGLTPEDALKALRDAQIRSATNEEERVYFLFDNCQNNQRTKKHKLPLENAWGVTDAGMEEFTDFLESSKPQHLETTRKVLKSRIKLTASIQNLQERIKTTELKQNEIKQTEEALKKHEEEMDKNKEFTVVVDEVEKVKEDIDAWWDYKAVTCNICEENCHYPGCTWAWKPSHCEVMKDGRCTSCTRKCPAEDHVKENWKYVTRMKKVKKTKDELKQKYEKNQRKSMEEKESLLENLQTEMEKLEAEKNHFLDEAYQHVEKLQSIALNVDSLSTYVHLDFLIEKMKERGDTEKVQKLEEMRKRREKGITSGLLVTYGKLRAAGKTFKDALK